MVGALEGRDKAGILSDHFARAGANWTPPPLALMTNLAAAFYKAAQADTKNGA